MSIDKLKKWIDESDNIVFFGGAGVSTESGIPDFRGEEGIYKTVSQYGVRPETILSHTFFLKEPAIFFEYYKNFLLCPNAEPNEAHLALAELEKRGKVKAIITQNIDNLHQKAGSENVLELHGTLYRNYCMNCRCEYETDFVVKSKGVPRCKKCSGIVRPDVVLYEEGLDGNVLDKAVRYISSADVLIVGGTSLAVYPAAGLVNYYKGNKLVLINKSETSFDKKADLIIHQAIGNVFEKIIQKS
ncbi:MAG: NAD-dependent protein deacylase [Firmicutes bacterium]|nr:NAD-dependent protein deacylase [Bacillota bacterium]